MTKKTDENEVNKTADDKRINDIEESVKEIAKYVKNEAIRLQELLEKRAPDREYLERMEKAKEEIDSNLRILQLLKQDIETMKGERESIENRIGKIEEKISSGTAGAPENIENRLDFLEKEFKEAAPTRKRLDEEAVLRMSIEKKLQEMGNKFENLAKTIKGGESQAPKIEAELKFRLQELEKRLSEMKAVEYKSKVAPSGNSRVISLERRLATLEKANEPVGEFDKKLELRVSRYLSGQLEDFAKALDKRLPNAALLDNYSKRVSETENRMKELESSIRTDFDKRLADLNQSMKSIEEKIKTVESPDLSPLVNRVALLERKMAEILAMMKSFASRMPVIVE